AQRGQCLVERGTLIDGHKGAIALARDCSGNSVGVPLAPAPCSTPPSYALPGTFAPRPGLIHLATPLRPGELKALFITENLVVLYSDLVELTATSLGS
ncbi:hypothetical protein KUCAC02_007214, partial [Chaenocephalus aceratus]